MELEDISFDGTHMILSAADGIYRLMQSDATMSLVLWGPKSFPVTDILMIGSVLFLYSPQTQSVHSFGDHGLQLVTSTGLGSSVNPGRFTSDGFLACYGSSAIALVDLSNSSVHLNCTVALGLLLDCIYVSVTRDSVTLQCGLVSIVLSDSGCSTSLQSPPQSVNLWADLMLASVDSVKREIIPYPVEYNLTDPSITLTMFYMRFYSPIGIFGEVPLASPRRYVSPGVDMLSLSNFVSYWKIFQFMSDNAPCSFSFCPFDVNTGFDVLMQKAATTSDWVDLIDSLVQNAASQYNLTSLGQIHSNASLYQELLSHFSMRLKQKTANLVVKRFYQHPVSGHLWLVRNDSLFEVSKSGVRVELTNGMCLTSSIALCPLCYWAYSGSPCQPCSVSNSSDWVWSVKCADCVTSRRMLSADHSIIRFTIASNIEAVLALWPQAREEPTGITVEVATQDPVSAMRSVKASLEAHPMLHVVIQPYQVIRPPVSAKRSIVRFTIAGNIKEVLALWPQAREESSGITVEVATQDPVSTMQSVEATLAEHPMLHVVIQPYLVVEPTPSACATDMFIVPTVVLSVFVIILAIMLCIKTNTASYPCVYVKINQP